MPEFTLRALGPADAADYRALRLRALREHPEAFTSSYEEEVTKPLDWSAQRLASDEKRPHDFFLGAFLPVAGGSQLAGMVGLVGQYRQKERHGATVVGMYVAPELAGQGAGMALMQSLIERARVLPELRQIDLTVTAGNERAEAVYARCGFSIYGVLRDAVRIGDSFHAKVHMVLRLRD